MSDQNINTRRRGFSVAFAMASLVLGACGGNDVSPNNITVVPSPVPIPTLNPTPVPTIAPAPVPANGLSISGRMLVPDTAIVDSDTADPERERVSNDFDLQIIEGPRATITGFARNTGSFDDPEADLFDSYRITLEPGQVVNLFIAGDGTENDLDLFLLEEDAEFGQDPEFDDFVSVSVALGKFETVIAPNEIDGVEVEGPRNYWVSVFAFAGSSNYVLSTGPDTVGFVEPTPLGGPSTLGFMPGQLIVKMKETPADGVKAKAQARSLGASTLASVPGGPQLMDVSLRAKSGHAGRLFGGGGERARALSTLYQQKAISRDPMVEYAQLNRIVQPLAIPDDPLFAQQAWHYDLINLPLAWDLTKGSTDVLVAVLDSGILVDHPDLVDNLDPNDPDGHDFVSTVEFARDGDGIDGDASDPFPDSHGTHVAGTIAAATGNGLGVAGVGWNTRLMPVRVLGGDVGISTFFDVFNGLLYAAGLPNSSGELPARPADIANLSLGGQSIETSYGRDPSKPGVNIQAQPSFFELDIIRRVREAGLIVIAAAGNNGDRFAFYPASYDGVVSVGATAPGAERSVYSTFNRFVDVSAPGGGFLGTPEQQVISTLSASSTDVTRLLPTYGGSQGTSMASPHVAGVVALMKAVHPGLTPEVFDQVLASGAITRDLGPPGKDWEYGHGLIDAHLAVMEAMRLAAGGEPGPAQEVPNLAVVFDYDDGSVLVERRFELGQQPSRRVLPRFPRTQSFDFGDAEPIVLRGEEAFQILNGGTGTLGEVSLVADVPWVETLALNGDGLVIGKLIFDEEKFLESGGDFSKETRFTLTVTAGEETVVTAITVLGVETSPNPSPELPPADLGPVRMRLLNSARQAVSEIQVSPNRQGFYDFSFDNLAPGQYGLIAGTDNDGDGSLCDAGEACAVFPLQDSPGVINLIGGSQRDLLFRLGFNVSVSAD